MRVVYKKAPFSDRDSPPNNLSIINQQRQMMICQPNAIALVQATFLRCKGVY